MRGRRSDGPPYTASVALCDGMVGGCGVVCMQRIDPHHLSLVYEAKSQHAPALATAQHGWDLQPPLPRCDLRVMYRLAFVDAGKTLGALGTAWPHAQ